MLAKYILYKENLNFVLISDKGIIKSAERGILPIYKTILESKDYFQAASIADRVIGNAAAILLAYAGIKELYSDLISQSALEILRARGILVSYAEMTEKILNQDKTGLCPMEKLSIDIPSPILLIERISDFLAK